ncbi:MAG TPA: S41 family peptidase [Clostridia bacterium]|nr:S41 family peptidase [Clostridia bacterium]
MTKRKTTLVTTLVLAVLMVALAFAPAPAALAAEAAEAPQQKSLEEQMDFLELLIKAVEGLYYEDVDIQDLIDGAYKGVFNKLDPYSVYYTDEEYEEFDLEVTGTFSGIGVQIALRDGHITVIAPLDDTPAQRAGIRAGDRIVFVDDTDVREISIDKVASMLRGEPGTKVRVGILREGQPAVIYFELTRETIEVNPVKYEVLEGSIGYIRISEFNQHAGERVDEALAHFDGLGIRDIILDLRDNPGGMVDQSVDVASRFVPEGPVVHIDRRTAPRQTLNSRLREPRYNLVVLVNGGSASASEIVAGAVQDTGAGTLIGTQTFGKGTVQQILPLENGSRIKLTIAKYLTPNGRAIDGVGITPDIVVENPAPEGKYGDSIAPIKGDRKLSVNAVGLDVLGAEQRLDTMGYNTGEVDGVFDADLEQAVRKFQSDKGLYPYGVLDFATQKRLLAEHRLYIEKNMPDLQLQKAVETLKSKR